MLHAPCLQYNTELFPVAQMVMKDVQLHATALIVLDFLHSEYFSSLYMTLEHKISHKQHRCICRNNFLNIYIFLHPQIPDFQILSDHNKPYINGNINYSDGEKFTLL